MLQLLEDFVPRPILGTALDSAGGLLHPDHLPSPQQELRPPLGPQLWHPGAVRHL